MRRLAEKEPLLAKSIPLITTEESAAGLVKVIEESTREKDGGEFLVYDGSKLAW